MPDFSLVETESPPLDSVNVDVGAPVAPTDPSATDVDSDTVDLSWTNQEVDHDGVRIYRDDGSGAVEIADLDRSATSYTDTAAPNGTQLEYYVEAYYEHTGQASQSGTDTVTTPLPDVSSFVLDASTVNELLVMQIEPVLNAGWYRIRWKEADASSYPSGNDATLAHDASPLEYVITGVLAGEKYDVRVRSETDDVTGDWLTASKVTKLVPADALQSSNATEAGVDLSWSDNSSPFDGSYQIYRDRADYDFADPDGELIGTVASTATSFADTTAVPNTAYEYTVRAVTQWVQSSSDALAATTAGPSVPKTRSRSAEWTVEIRLDDRTLRPPVVDEPTLQPRANDLPKIRLPTTEGPWSRLALEDGAEDMALWYDGVRQPIEALERIEEADNGQVLVGRGGTALLDRVQVEVDQQPVHELVEDLLQDETPYDAVVDAPPEDVSEEIIFDVVEASAWNNLFVNTELSRIPVGVDESTDELYNQQSNWVREAESPDHEVGISSGDFDELPDYSGPSGQGTGGAYLLDSTNGTDPNDALEYEFETEYTIPAEALNVRTRWRDGDDVELTISIDGNTFCVVPTNYSSSLLWGDPKSTSIIDVVWSADLEPGTHTLRYEVTDTGSNVEPHVLDVVSVGDDRYDYNYDNDVTSYSSGNYLDGPELYPVAEVETDLEPLVLSAVGADLTTVWDDASGDQRIQMTNDGGTTWRPDDGSEDNTQTVTHDWADPGASVGVRLRFGRRGSQDTTPANGIQGQRVDSLELVAELDDTPLAVNQAWDTSLRDVLRDLAEQAGALWDVEYDDGLEVNWTLPGQREATVDAAVTTYDVATDVREQAARVVVLGGNAHQVGDRITADHDTAVDLQQSDLVAGRESVYELDGGVSYQRDDDYEIDYNDGTITTLEAGDVGDGQTVVLDYDYETRGAFESEEATTDRSITRNITGLTSSRQCAIAARRISLELREALIEAEIGVQPGPRSWSVVDQLDVAALPDVQALDVKQITTQAGEVRLRLGSRQSVEEIVSEIQDNADRVARRV